jgi:hypothetical protein
MINHSLPIAVIFFASETPDHLACRHRRDRNWNVSQAFSRNFDMMSSRGRQSNQSLCDSPQTTTTLALLCCVLVGSSPGIAGANKKRP